MATDLGFMNDGVQALEGVTLNGEALEVASWWCCACSGGHEYGFTPKCARKGGGTMHGLVVAGKLRRDLLDDDDLDW